MPMGKSYQAGMGSSPKGAGSYSTPKTGHSYRKMPYATKTNYAPPRHGDDFGAKGSGAAMCMGPLVTKGDSSQHGMGM